MLLHGFPQIGPSWDVLTPPLTEAGYRVLAPDQRGYAPRRSPRGRRAYRMSELAGDVVALLDEAGIDRAHVVGHDWGAAAAWARRRAGTRAAALADGTVGSAPVGHDAGRVHQHRRLLKSWYMLLLPAPVAAGAAARSAPSGGAGARLVRALVGFGPGAQRRRT